jgi:hypothetical protein
MWIPTLEWLENAAARKHKQTPLEEESKKEVCASSPQLGAHSILPVPRAVDIFRPSIEIAEM